VLFEVYGLFETLYVKDSFHSKFSSRLAAFMHRWTRKCFRPLEKPHLWGVYLWTDPPMGGLSLDWPTYLWGVYPWTDPWWNALSDDS